MAERVLVRQVTFSGLGYQLQWPSGRLLPQQGAYTAILWLPQQGNLGRSDLISISTTEHRSTQHPLLHIITTLTLDSLGPASARHRVVHPTQHCVLPRHGDFILSLCLRPHSHSRYPLLWVVLQVLPRYLPSRGSRCTFQSHRHRH